VTAEDEQVRLEHRLTKIEEGQVATQIIVLRIENKVDTQNGKVAEHMVKDDLWMNDHDRKQALADGYTKGMRAVLAGLIVVMGIAGPIVARAIWGA
jgi:hypothetical protein